MWKKINLCNTSLDSRVFLWTLGGGSSPRPHALPDSVGKAILDSYVQSPDCKLDEGQPQSHAISPGFGPFCQLLLLLPQVILIGWLLSSERPINTCVERGYLLHKLLRKRQHISQLRGRGRQIFARTVIVSSLASGVKAVFYLPPRKS